MQLINNLHELVLKDIAKISNKGEQDIYIFLGGGGYIHVIVPKIALEPIRILLSLLICKNTLKIEPCSAKG